MRKYDVAELRKSGLTLAQLAERYGVSRQRIWTVLHPKPPRPRQHWARRNVIRDSAVLTARQSQIAKLARKGLSNLQIAKQLGIAVGTVKIHLYNAYSKQSES